MSYPVTFEADYVERRSRLTAFLRLILAIPLAIWVDIYGIVAYCAVFIAWFAIVITGRYPKGLYDFVAGYARLRARTAAYATLLCEGHPSFNGADDPVVPAVDGMRARVMPRGYAAAAAAARLETESFLVRIRDTRLCC